MRDKKDFSIVGEQELDAFGSESWKNYLDSSRLGYAWSTPDGSPFESYVKYTTIYSVDNLRDQLKPRYSERERNSENGVGNLIRSGNANQETAVILDSGGGTQRSDGYKIDGARISASCYVRLNSTPRWIN